MTARLRALDGVTELPELESNGVSNDRWLGWILRKFPEPSLHESRRRKLLLKLARAGFVGRSNTKVFEAARLILMILLSAGATILVAPITRSWKDAVFSAACGVVMGGILPDYYLARRIRMRQAQLSRELADVIDLLIVCVEAGQGLYEAVKTVGNVCARQRQAFGVELAMLSGELAAGASLAEGLHSMAERTGLDDIRSLAAVLVQSERLGARMGAALRAVSDSLRLKRKLRAEEAAQKATIKMLFPLILFVLPAMMLVVVGPALVQIFATLHRQ